MKRFIATQTELWHRIWVWVGANDNLGPTARYRVYLDIPVPYKFMVRDTHRV